MKARGVCCLQERKVPFLRVEEVDDEGCEGRPFAGPAPGRRDGVAAGGREAKESLGGGGAQEPLMRTETEVVREDDIEPSLQITDGQGWMESKARGLLEGSPESFDPGGGEDVLRGAEAVNDPELRRGLGEDASGELPTLVADEVLGRTKGSRGRSEGRAMAEAPGLCSEGERARGTREKASRTAAR